MSFRISSENLSGVLACIGEFFLPGDYRFSAVQFGMSRPCALASFAGMTTLLSGVRNRTLRPRSDPKEMTPETAKMVEGDAANNAAAADRRVRAGRQIVPPQ